MILYTHRILTPEQECNDKVLEATCIVLAGYYLVSSATFQELVDQAIGSGDEAIAPIERLIDRELETFCLIGEGLTGTSGAIANRPFLSTHTIATHRENIKRKVNLKNGGELSRAAGQWVLENE